MQFALEIGGMSGPVCKGSAMKLTKQQCGYCLHSYESFRYLNSFINFFSMGVRQRRMPPTTFCKGAGSFRKNSLN